MNTAFLLMAQYGRAAVIPIDAVCRDYFWHLSPQKLVQKISAGEIVLAPRPDGSQRAVRQGRSPG